MASAAAELVAEREPELLKTLDPNRSFVGAEDLVRMALEQYTEILETASDPRVSDWPLMESPIPTFLIVLLYLYGVVILGPKIMANRKSFQLRKILVAYNAFQVIFSIGMLYEHLMSGWLLDYSYKCQPVDYSHNPTAMRMANLCWWYFISKFTEFADTIFFVLRKKDSQVTFLHLYHHSLTPLETWICVKFIAGGHGTLGNLINNAVHVVMYAYYMLSAMGPEYQKYLWWKKHLTTVQLLDDNRNIISANCNCKTGVAQQCKHICAAIHFVNSPDSAASKTSQSQGWGKPSHRQLLGYDKGARISTLFPPPPLCSKAEKLTPFHVTTENLKEFVPFSPLFQILQFEERNQVEIIAAETLAEIKRMTDKNNLLEKAKKVTLDIFTLQLVNNLHGVECETLKQWHDFYQNKVCCYVDKALSISIGTIDQSEKSEWFEERKLRITASNGHKVKGNRFDIEKIIDEFLNPSKHETSAMSYGKKTEEIALKEYKKLLQPNWEVVRVGLIVNIPQPWMSCSPDSIVIYGPNIWQKKLIEVKCPYSCRNQPIFNEESLEIHVQYLKFDENGLHLSTTHSIYTQIQLQMYVTNIAFCDLFIYSPMGSVLITVGRDEAFLNKVIPALQKFYFQHYLQRLFSMHSKKN